MDSSCDSHDDTDTDPHLSTTPRCKRLIIKFPVLYQPPTPSALFTIRRSLGFNRAIKAKNGLQQFAYVQRIEKKISKCSYRAAFLNKSVQNFAHRHAGIRQYITTAVGVIQWAPLPVISR